MGEKRYSSGLFMLLFVMSVSCIVKVARGANIYYVAPGGLSQPPYSSWHNAATNIFDATGLAEAGDFVYLSNGVYMLSSTLSINDAFTVEGVNGMDHTILDRNKNGRVVSVSGSGVLRGVTITNGYGALLGAGAYVLDGTIAECRITGNGTTVYSSSGGGAGFFIIHIDGLITDSEVIGNYFDRSGGYVYGGGGYIRSGTIRDSLIAHNVVTGSAYYAGAGLYLRGENSLAENCVISNNSANTAPAGVYLLGGATAFNCKIVNNTGNHGGDGGGGVMFNGGNIRNCLVSGNAHGGVSCQGGSLAESSTIAGNFSYGIYCANNRVHLFVNTVTYSNETYDIRPSAGSGGTFMTNSCYGVRIYSSVLGSGNITNEPVFIDPGAGDYRLYWSGNPEKRSPCIDTGLNQGWMNNAVDVDGNPRIINGTVDMGALEYVPPPPGIIMQFF